jgi:hypothetical protein
LLIDDTMVDLSIFGFDLVEKNATTHRKCKNMTCSLPGFLKMLCVLRTPNNFAYEILFISD